MPAVPFKTEVDRNVDATALQAQCSEGATLADVQRYQRMVRAHIASVLFATSSSFSSCNGYASDI
jgi:hypothetical protein